ncbi:APC family permease [Alicyclobacillus sendaiensis]|uniref:APC family permease n=1 Tax=Alicyclobacillus sendaiensis TaxID=192387 RepID=UPI000780EDE3|nr:amino acid permease [Alicyclobacillus sendaiensis]
MQPSGPELVKTLTLGRGVALALGIVIGAGVLVLPGEAYAQAGDASIYAWLLDAGLVIPLLWIFSELGARYPSAGGAAGFVRSACGFRLGILAECLLMGAFFLGIPAIALSGADYLAALTGLRGWRPDACAALLIMFVSAMHAFGARVSATAQQILSFTLVGVLGFIACVGLFAHPRAGLHVAPFSDWCRSLSVIGMVFFAYTGWEMISFLGEEFKRPKRDFPLTIALSYVAIIILYIAVVLAVQTDLSAHDPRTSVAPMAALLTRVTGPVAADGVAILAVVIIVANLNGAIWAASRLMFAAAREGTLPRRLAVLSRRGVPWVAVGVCAFVFVAVIGMHRAGLISQSLMFALAGQNFLLIYGLCAIAYIRQSAERWRKVVGFAVGMMSLVVLSSFGWKLVYPLAIAAAALAVARLRSSTGRVG